jgi:hypothetical protein
MRTSVAPCDVRRHRENPEKDLMARAYRLLADELGDQGRPIPRLPDILLAMRGPGHDARLGVGRLLLALVSAACGDSPDGEGSSSTSGHVGGSTTGGADSSGGHSSDDGSSEGTSGAPSTSAATADTSSSGSSAADSSEGSTGQGAKSYSTEFDGSENPLSEGGVWTNGGDVGIDWQNQAKDQGIAFGTGFSAGYDDCIAHLSGFAADHYAQASVHVETGYTPPSSHEVELLLRFEITANNARGYEVLCGWNGAYSQIVRWNGPLDDFTYLDTTGPGFGALVEGDVIRAEAVGDTITAYKNGSQVMQATDSTWADGNPGMGFFIRPGEGAEPTSYCYDSYAAGDL